MKRKYIPIEMKYRKRRLDFIAKYQKERIAIVGKGSLDHGEFSLTDEQMLNRLIEIPSGIAIGENTLDETKEELESSKLPYVDYKYDCY